MSKKKNNTDNGLNLSKFNNQMSKKKKVEKNCGKKKN